MKHKTVDIDLGMQSPIQPKPKRTPRKHWLKSRTLWVNTIAALLLTAESSLQIVQPIVGEKMYLWISFGLVLINVVLRSLTTHAIGADDAE